MGYTQTKADKSLVYNSMKKHSKLFILAIALLSCATICFAQTTKVITLKDGSSLKGKVLQLSNGTYTVETSNLGRLNIPESDVLSITPLENDGTSNQQKTQMKNQVQAIQGSILSDPALMMELQDIVSDEEVQAMLSDPQLLNDVLSYDQQKIQENDNVQDLMQNEKIQNLMKKIYQKMPAEE
jgi:hypothetical protein